MRHLERACEVYFGREALLITNGHDEYLRALEETRNGAKIYGASGTDESPYLLTVAFHRMENVKSDRDIGRHGDYRAEEIKIPVPHGRTEEVRRAAACYEGIKGEV